MTLTRLAVAEASAHTLRDAAPLSTEHVPLEQSLGRVLASDMRAEVFLPPWDNASMDGYAVRAADVNAASASAPVELRVVGTVPAGQRTDRVLSAGEAIRIMTGAPVPAGADSVVRVEDTDRGSERVSIRDARDAGRNVRAKGEDVRPDQVVLSAGTPLSAAQVGVLSSIGAASVPVYRKPSVAILATGDELVPVEEFARVRAGERIVSSNSYSLAAAVTAAGGVPVSLGIATDSPEAIAHALRGAEGCDLLLTSGGVSVGDFDFTRTVVEQLGGSLSMWRVLMRPGAPLGFGSLLGMPWFGLPGNPVSALVTFELFVRPFIRTLGGHRLPHRRTIGVVLDEPVQLAAPLTHYFRVLLSDGPDGQPHARLTGAQSSGMLTSMGAADALLVVPPEPSIHPDGALLRAIPLDGDLGGSTRFPG